MTGSDGDPPIKGVGPEEDPTGIYVVGYGKPPEHGKIKPGEVRNRLGKRKGTRSFRAEAREMLAMPVSVTGAKGKARKISTRVAVMLKLREKALKGDSRALDRMMEMMREHDLEDSSGTTSGLQKEDADILERARQRHREPVSEVPASPDSAANNPKEQS